MALVDHGSGEERTGSGPEHQFHLLLDALDVAAYLCDAAGRITYCNPAAAGLWGVTPRPDEARDRFCGPGRPFDREGHPIEREQCWAARTIRDDVESGPEQIRIVRPDGRERSVLARSNPLHDADGRVIGAVCLLVDVSAQKEAEEAEARLAAIVEASSDAILSRSLDGRVLTWNSGAARMFGFAPEETIGKSTDPTLPPEAHDDDTRLLGRIAHGEPVEPYEARRLTSRGDPLRVSIAQSPIHDHEGRVIGTSIVERDVTEQNRMVESLVSVKNELATQLADLRRLHALSVRLWTTTELRPIMEDVLRTAAAVEGAPLGLLSLCDPEQEVLRIGASVGFDAEYLMKVSAAPLGAGGCGACYERRERVVVEDVETDPIFADWREQARRVGYRSAHSTPLITCTGKIVGVLSVYFRERHRPSDRAMHFADLCARQAADSIENARLYGDLREADRAKDEFLAVLAHELRNPLSPIRNSAELLRLLPTDSNESRSALEVINRQVGHMTRLIEDLLDVARITGGKLELRRSRILLSEVVDVATETSRALLEEKQQPLHVVLPGRRVFLDADLTRLAQVVANLLNNASKFSPPGSPIALTATWDHGEVTISVRDAGIGIPEEGLTRIFEIFCQASTDRTQGGLGIGLTLVKRLTEMHGGTVRALSGGPGKGSEFVVRLPAAGPETNGKSDPAAAGAGEPAPVHRILIVDDNRDAADSLGMILRIKGSDVRIAYDGREALAVAREFRPTVVLLDIGLPSMSGYDVARELRKLAETADALLIATTGWSQPSDRERSRQAGFDHHLVKPIEPAVLLALLRDATTSH